MTILSGILAADGGNIIGSVVRGIFGPLSEDAPDSLLTSLVAWWPMDEESGTRVNAHNPGTYDLTDNNTVTFQAGVAGNEAVFVAANDEYLSIASVGAGNLDFTTGDFTVCGWAIINSSSETEAFIISKGANVAVSSGQWAIKRSAVSESILFGCNSTAGAKLTSAKAITYGTRFFFCAEFVASEQTIYLDVNNSGSPVSNAMGGNGQSGTSNVIMGGRGTGPTANNLNGAADEVAIWSRLLTAGEKTRLAAGMGYPG